MRAAAIAFAGSIALAAWLLASAFPQHPRAWIGWVVMLLLGPPLSLLALRTQDRLSRRPMRQRVEWGARVVRLLHLFTAMALVLACVAAVSAWLPPPS
jgi:hypothetical protein